MQTTGSKKISAFYYSNHSKVHRQCRRRRHHHHIHLSLYQNLR